MDSELAELQIEYLKDLPEKLDQIYELAINLEKPQKFEESLTTLKGIIHSIKGSSGSYEITFISDLCHKFEDQLDLLEQGKSNISKSFLFIDLLRSYLDFYYPGQEVDNSEFTRKLDELSEESTTTEATKKGANELKKTLIISFDNFITAGIRLALSKYNINLTSIENLKDIKKLKKDITFDEIFIDESAKGTIDALEKKKLLKIQGNIFYIKSSEKGDGPKEGNFKILNKSFLLIKDIQKAHQTIAERIKENPGTILLVDDDDSLYPLFRKAFKKYDQIKITTCSSAKEAYQLLEKEDFDLLLLDFMMPEISGQEMFKTLRKKEIHIPIIFLTGLSKPEEIEEMEKLGASGILTKPFKISELAGQILDIWSRI